MKGCDDVFRMQVRSIFTFLLAVFMLVSATQFVEAANTQQIVFINETGITLTELHCYYEGSNSDNNLAKKPLKNGESTRIMVDPDKRYCNFRFIFSGGVPFYLTKYDYSGVFLIRFRPSSNKAGSYMIHKN